MPITITNIGGNPLGVSRYRVTINGRTKAEFKHDRRLGLAECFRAAAAAVDRAEAESMAADLERIAAPE